MDPRLARLCDLARAHGLIVGPTELLRLGLVLGSAPEERWEALAAPILVKGPDAEAARAQRAALAAAVAEWAATRPAAEVGEVTPGMGGTEGARVRPARAGQRRGRGEVLRRLMLMLMLMLMFLQPAAPPSIEAPALEQPEPTEPIQETVAELVSAPRTVRTWVPVFEDLHVPGRDRAGPWIVLAAALLGLGLVRLAPRRSPPPRPLPARAPPAGRGRSAPTLLLDPSDVDELESGVRRHAVDAPSRRLDLAATVRATANTAGIPSLRWRPGRRSLGAWLWLDRSSVVPETTALAVEIARALDRAGLPVSVSEFRGLPDPLVGEDGVRSPSSAEPGSRAARVLVLTDGALLADAIARGDPRAVTLLAELGTWDNLAFVDFGGELAAALAPWRLRVVPPEAAVAELAGVALRPGVDTDLSRWAALCALRGGPVRREEALGLRQALGLEVGVWWAAALDVGEPDPEERAALLRRLDLVADRELPPLVERAIQHWLDHAGDAVEAAALGLWRRETLGAALDALIRLDADAVRAAVGALVPADAPVEHPAAIHLPWTLAALPAERREQLARVGLGWDVGWRADGELRPPGRRRAGTALLVAGAAAAVGMGLLPWVGGGQEGWVTEGQEPPVPHGVEPVAGAGVRAWTPWVFETDPRSAGRVRWEERDLPCEEPPEAEGGVRVNRCTSAGALPTAPSGRPGPTWAFVTPTERSMMNPELTRLIRALLDGGTADLVLTSTLDATPNLEGNTPDRMTVDARDPAALAEALQFEGCRPGSEVPVWKEQGGSEDWILCGTGARCGDGVQECEKIGCDLGSDLCTVTIPRGSVRIGTPSGGDADERSTWTVEFSRDFQMLATEVTVAQYERRPARSDEDRKPKVSVNWTEARDWCAALGSGWRLPSEVEWEYAARAGTTTTWFFGEDAARLDEYAWFGEDYYPIGQHPVARKKPSPWGLYDLYGNVWEWTLDGYVDAYAWSKAWRRFPGTDLARDPRAHVDESVNNVRVIRGGAFFDSADWVQSAFRNWYYPGDEFWNLGFRCVRSSLPQPP